MLRFRFKGREDIHKEKAEIVKGSVIIWCLHASQVI